jgi:hypothetical protein
MARRREGKGGMSAGIANTKVEDWSYWESGMEQESSMGYKSQQDGMQSQDLTKIRSMVKSKKTLTR